jgi:DNA invertase Pin-like site-specific DNA recombinase
MKKKTAIGYCRKSTKDMQENSLEIQEEIIRKYADEQGLEVIKIFSDKASGRQVKGRDSFLELLRWVEKKTFQKILVRDVTRWGRFDDVDESAYWEYHCKIHGKEVIFIEEDFRNDNSLYDALVKNIKRVMAAEYSRKLGKLVLAGSKKIASQGFTLGGSTPYGLKRMLVSQKRVHLRILNKGERKSVGNERVVFVPGNKEQIENVNLIYSLYIDDLLGGTKICNYLNGHAIPSPTGGKWRANTIYTILKREIYIGTMVYNMVSKVPGANEKKRNPESEWVKCKGAFIPIIEKGVFFEAKKMREARRRSYSDDELLSMLRDQYQKYGIISSSLFFRNGLPRAETYKKRFGSLETALLLSQKEMVEEAKEMTLSGLKKYYRVEESNGSYLIEEKIQLGIKVSLPLLRKKAACWSFQLKRKGDDFTLGLGLEGNNSTRILRYFLFPNLLMGRETINIPIGMPGFHEIYEYKKLNIF